MNEFDEQTSHVSKILHDTSAYLDVPTVGVAAVRRRGSTRQHRRRAYAATASVVVLLGTGVLVVQRLSGSPKRTIAPAPEDSRNREARRIASSRRPTCLSAAQAARS